MFQNPFMLIICGIAVFLILLIVIIASHFLKKKAPEATPVAEKSSVLEEEYTVGALGSPSDYNYGKVFLGSFVSFDLETTGLSPTTDQIIEIGALRFRGWESVDMFHTYVKPLGLIPPRITDINHISNSDVANAPTIDEAMDKFLDFIGTDMLVAHNAPFDMGFLKNNTQKPILNLVADTLSLSRLWFSHLPNHKLETLKDYFHINSGPSHSAISDASATGFVYNHCRNASAMYFHQNPVTPDPFEAAMLGPHGGGDFFYKQFYRICSLQIPEVPDDFCEHPSKYLRIWNGAPIFKDGPQCFVALVIDGKLPQLFAFTTNPTFDALLWEYVKNDLYDYDPDSLFSIENCHETNGGTFYNLSIHIPFKLSEGDVMVYTSSNHSRYHANTKCSKAAQMSLSLSYAKHLNIKPCPKCYPPPVDSEAAQ